MIFASQISHGPISSLRLPSSRLFVTSILLNSHLCHQRFNFQANLANGLRQAIWKMLLRSASLAVWRAVRCMWFPFQWDQLAVQSQRTALNWPIRPMWSFQWTLWPECTNRFWMKLAIRMILSSVSTQSVVHSRWNANWPTTGHVTQNRSA